MDGDELSEGGSRCGHLAQSVFGQRLFTKRAAQKGVVGPSQQVLSIKTDDLLKSAQRPAFLTPPSIRQGLAKLSGELPVPSGQSPRPERMAVDVDQSKRFESIEIVEQHAFEVTGAGRRERSGVETYPR